MLFNSYEFIFLFMPAVLIVLFTVPKACRKKFAVHWLILMSVIFYGYWDFRYVPLLIFSILCNFFVGRRIFHSSERKKFWLVCGISFNLILLFYFKYTGFFLTNVNETFGQNFFVPEIVLPLGISFFTFTQTAFLVDTFRGEVSEYSFSEYGLFVTIFPHLLAGPILYHKDIIPQFDKLKDSDFDAKNFSEGLILFVAGLFKKVAIADSLGTWVNLAFGHSAELTCADAWLGALIYSMRLYFDFSGYSEMAMGLGKMMNLNLPQNFDSPYRSVSIIDFWRRWHITLGMFVKNYIYIPLGGNRHGQLAKMRNLFLCMVIIGLWHGASWGCVLWGAAHGIFLVVNNLWRKFGFSLPNLLSWFITFICVVCARVVFLADDVFESFHTLGKMFLFQTTELSVMKDFGMDSAAILILACVLSFLCPSVPSLAKNFRPDWKCAFAVSAALIFSLLLMANHISEFLYFRF